MISLCKRWCTLALLCAVAQVVAAQPFSFVALGDLPYGQAAQGYAPYKSLIRSINQERPIFSIHVGDFKSGSTLCSDEESQVQLGHFGLFDSALVFTPGDNEWTDCHRANNGGHDPLERLQALRATFYKPGSSLGKQPLPVLNQSVTTPAFAKFVENQRWFHQGVVFATVHIVGSNNNFEVRDPEPWLNFLNVKRPTSPGYVKRLQAPHRHRPKPLFWPCKQACLNPRACGRTSLRTLVSAQALGRLCYPWQRNPKSRCC
jgi:hypothetical protein